MIWWRAESVANECATQIAISLPCGGHQLPPHLFSKRRVHGGRGSGCIPIGLSHCASPKWRERARAPRARRRCAQACACRGRATRLQCSRRAACGAFAERASAVRLRSALLAHVGRSSWRAPGLRCVSSCGAGQAAGGYRRRRRGRRLATSVALAAVCERAAARGWVGRVRRVGRVERVGRVGQHVARQARHMASGVLAARSRRRVRVRVPPHSRRLVAQGAWGQGRCARRAGAWRAACMHGVWPRGVRRGGALQQPVSGVRHRSSTQKSAM